MTIYMVTHKMRFHGQECRNTYYYETTVGDPSTSEWTDIVDEIRADIVTELMAQLTLEWTFYAIDYREVDALGLPTLSVAPTAGDIAGTVNGDSVATQIAMLLIVKGDTAKPRQGRSFLCGFGESKLVDSLWTSASRTAAEAFVDEQTGLNAGGTNPLQRVAAQWNTSKTEVTATNNIAAFASIASVVPATQRRRRIGVGI